MSDRSLTHSLPPFLGAGMVLTGLFFCAVPFFPALGGAAPQLTPLSALAWSTVCLAYFVAAAFLFRYQVTITEAAIAVRSFRLRVIHFVDIVDVELIGPRSRELIVYLSGGQRIHLSGLLSDFDELCRSVRARMAGPPDGRTDSIEKTSYQQKRARAGRRAQMISYGGLALVVIVLLVAKMME